MGEGEGINQAAQVCYLYQSAFTVALNKTLLVFSYRESNLPQLAESQRLSDKDFLGFNNILVFVPNASAEHHDPAIYEWKRSFPITYIMPAEAAKAAPKSANVRVCREGDNFSVGQCEITAYGSTDTGLSFLAKAEGIRVFHAGDLNLWHWREENSLREIAKAEASFYKKVERIPKNGMDICMFPLDPHQGGFYDAGANHFIMTLRPKVFFPMHFGARGEIAAEYARRGISRRTVVFALTQVRESAVVDFSGPLPVVRSSNQTKADRARQRGARISLNAYTHEDPFSQTDLPVDLKEKRNS
jgi:hypothetical protein